jgi:hypothetical protein
MRDDLLNAKPGIPGVTGNTMSSEPLINLKLAFADAMWTWAHVETQIFAIYVAAVGGLTIDMRPIRAAFFAINSFEMRLTMTHAALKERWPRHPLLKVWSALRGRCDKAAGQRGRIAHRAGTVWWPEKPHQKVLVALHEPTWHHAAPQNWGTAKSTGIDEAMLRQFESDWHKINYDLSQFALRVWQEARLPTSLEPPPG